MTRNFLAYSFAAAALAGVTAVASPVMTAFGNTQQELSKEEYARHINTVFERADLNGDGYLQADEFASLMVVETELSRLNRLVALETGETTSIPVPAKTPARLSPTERSVVEALAYRNYYTESDARGRLNLTGFQRLSMQTFVGADRNGDGVLTGAELNRFAAAVTGFDNQAS